MNVIILVDIRTRVKIDDKLNIMYVVYLTNPPITVHCTRNQDEFLSHRFHHWFIWQMFVLWNTTVRQYD